jgi:uncharacterized protein (DUF433 family)
VSPERLREIAESRGDARAPEEWQGRRLYAVAGDVFPNHEDALAAAGSPDGIEEIDLAAIAEEVRRDVDRLAERTPDQIGRVAHDRYIMNGEPIIAGTRIPIVTILAEVRRRASPAEIVDAYPRLTEEDGAAAVAFQEQNPLSGNFRRAQVAVDL